MNRLPAILAFIFLLITRADGDEVPGPEARHLSVFGSFGFLELASAGILYQFSDQYAFGAIVTRSALGGRSYFGPNNTAGIGIRGSYYFDRTGSTNFLWSNVISVDCQYLFVIREGKTVTFHNPGGLGVEAIVGRDGFIGPGIGILWGAGLSATFHSEYPPLFFPAFRLGVHFDI